MPAKSDPLDITFMDRIKNMLGLDKDEASGRLEELDSDELLDLTDAVSTGDKERAKQILKVEKNEEDEDSRKDINPLFGPETRNVEDDEEDEPPSEAKPSSGRRRKDKESDDDGEQYDIGDKVKIKDKKRGVVEIPQGPSNTVGVRVSGRLHMINRGDLSRLDEHVLGMTGVPDIARLQMLAGIAPAAEASFPQIIDLPAVEEPSVCTNSAQIADEALTTLEREIGNVKVAELSPIRRRLMAICNRLNESAKRR